MKRERLVEILIESGLDSSAWSVADLILDEIEKGSTPTGEGEHVRHVKRGTEYEVLGEAEAQVSVGDQSVAPVEGVEVPDGAIYNGHVFLRRLSDHYRFCDEDGGPIALCVDYVEAVRCFEVMADYIALTALAAPKANGVGTGEEGVDEVVSSLYRRFKEWTKRGFGPDDVTWCEVKADVLSLIRAHTPSHPKPEEPTSQAVPVSSEAERDGALSKALSQLASAEKAMKEAESAALKAYAIEPRGLRRTYEMDGASRVLDVAKKAREAAVQTLIASSSVPTPQQGLGERDTAPTSPSKSSGEEA